MIKNKFKVILLICLAIYSVVLYCAFDEVIKPENNGLNNSISGTQLIAIKIISILFILFIQICILLILYLIIKWGYKKILKQGNDNDVFSIFFYTQSGIKYILLSAYTLGNVLSGMQNSKPLLRIISVIISLLISSSIIQVYLKNIDRKKKIIIALIFIPILLI